MQVYHSEATKLRRARTELHDGQLMTPFECPERVDLVLAQLRDSGVGPVSEPREAKQSPAAVATPDPEEETPDQVSASHGLTGVGRSGW